MFKVFLILKHVAFQLKKIKKRKQVSVSLVSNTFYANDIFIKNCFIFEVAKIKDGHYKGADEIVESEL